MAGIIARVLSVTASACMLAACGGSSFDYAGSARSAQNDSSYAQARWGHAVPAAVVRRVRPGGVFGYGPADLEAAYNLPSATQGAGQIVAVVDAHDNPNVAADLATYRSQFGLPAATFAKYNQDGQQSNYPSGDTGWGLQMDIDTQMVSASCPRCTIYLVEANSDAWSDLQKAESEAVALGATTVSNSFTGSGADQKYFRRRGVTYLAAASTQVDGEPAAFPSVVAVGGTTLHKGGGGARGWSESVWRSGSGGCTTFPKPRWQHDTLCTARTVNDVSAVADPSTGVAAYDSYGFSGWSVVGGNAIPTPLLAGVFGLAGNASQQDGGRTFWLRAHHAFLYRVKNGTHQRYSEEAGWGSPDGIGAF